MLNICDVGKNPIPIEDIYHLCIREEVCGFIVLATTQYGNKVLACRDTEEEIYQDYQTIRDFIEWGMDENSSNPL